MEQFYYEPADFRARRYRCVEIFYTGQKHLHPKHFHTMHELVFFDHFQGSVWIDGKEYFCDSPFLIYIPPLRVHQFHILEKTTHWFLFQSDTFHQSLLDQPPEWRNRVFAAEPDPVWKERLRGLMSWLLAEGDRGGGFGVEREISSLLAKTFLYLENQLPHHHRENAVDQVFLPLLKYLEEKKIYQLSVKEAAELCDLSTTYFQTRFKKYFGVNYHRFLQERILQAAIVMLKESSLSVLQIGLELGFDSPSYFCKLFKKGTGLSPLQYRKKIPYFLWKPPSNA